MKPIKVAYNWIGPTGPIWNTELPNVMSLAAATPDTSVRSSRWWADDAWNRLFRPCQPDYELAPSVQLTPEDVFIIPYSITWRIQFRNYFYIPDGILEFSHTQQNVIHSVRTGKGYILIDCSAETFVQDNQLHAMHDYFSAHHKIPLHKIIYVTGCMNANQIYNLFCHRNRIPNDPSSRMTILPFPTSQSGFAQLIKGYKPEDFPTYDENVVPEKLFLVWNRRFKTHRVGITLALSKLNLLDRSHVSMSFVDQEQPSETILKHIDLFAYPQLGLTSDDVDTLINKLPLVLDGETNTAKMCGDMENNTRPFYQTSLVSIITETNYNLSEMSLTEKSFKPIRELHPFIILGVPGILQVLRDLGFKTFNDFWDESYDLIEDPRIRMLEVVKICKQIGEWDNDKILEFRRNVKPILMHNFSILTKDLGLQVSEKIRDMIRGRYPE